MFVGLQILNQYILNLEFLKINVRKNRIDNQKWTIQIHWQIWVHKTPKEDIRIFILHKTPKEDTSTSIRIFILPGTYKYYPHKWPIVYNKHG